MTVFLSQITAFFTAIILVVTNFLGIDIDMSDKKVDDFKVTTYLIACNFIWSVSQASNEGRGIRLPMTLKKWHRQAD